MGEVVVFRAVAVFLGDRQHGIEKLRHIGDRLLLVDRILVRTQGRLDKTDRGKAAGHLVIQLVAQRIADQTGIIDPGVDLSDIRKSAVGGLLGGGRGIGRADVPGHQRSVAAVLTVAFGIIEVAGVCDRAVFQIAAAVRMAEQTEALVVAHVERDGTATRNGDR